MSPELQLAKACCRFPRSPEARDAIAAAMARPIDWARFDEIVQRHRIVGLASSALCDGTLGIPVDVRQRLADNARRYAANDLAHAAETVRLQQIFDQAGTPAVFLKGVAVGILAYGGLGVKQSWDIDLLTTEPCMARALQVLESSGYRLIDPADLPRGALPRFARFYHEAQLRSDRGITVELHWRLFSKPVLSGVTAASETQAVQIGGHEVRTFREDLLIAYLIAHGQEHGWGRLKWIADLNALLAQKSRDDLAKLYEQVIALGLGSKASAALLLCARLFDLPLPGELEAALRQDRSAKRLVEVNLDCIAHPRTGADMPLLSRISLTLIASRFAQGGGGRALFGEFGALWTQPAVRARYPAALDFLYHLLRVPIWVLRLPYRLNQLRRAAPGREC